MAKKKKGRDFQKVRIKVGRKLKRQNETIVDLTRKKIRLPREREITMGVPDQTGFHVVDEAICSLGLEKSALQLQAVQSLNNILDPFVKQLASFSFAECSFLTVQARSVAPLIALYRALLHCKSPSQLGLQLGDLSCTLARVCRGAQDPRICAGICQLCQKLLRVFSLHRNFQDFLRTLDVCAVALLQRVESTWLWFGCRLADLALQAHCEFVCSMTLEFGYTKPCVGLIDPVEQLIRSSVLSRALAHLYIDLKQRTMNDTSRDRVSLLQATLNYFKDDQYSTHAAYSTHSHPFGLTVSTLPIFDELSKKFHLPLHGYALTKLLQSSLSSTVVDFPLMDMEARNLLFEQPRTKPNACSGSSYRPKQMPRKMVNQEKPFIISNSQTEDMVLGRQQLENERAMVCGLLEEGFKLLGELTTELDINVLSGLYCVLRCLRVLMESKSVTFFAPTFSGNQSSNSEKNSDVGYALDRFVTRLYSLFPVRFALVSDSANIGQSAVFRPAPGLSRQELRRALKRTTKLRNREQRRQTSQPDGGSQSQSDVRQHTTNSRSTPICSNTPSMVHLVNQTALEFFTYLECGNPVSQPNLWPPPRETQVRFIEFLVTHLLDDTSNNDAPSLGVLLSWLRSFDIYLLAPIRSPSRFSLIPTESRLFAAPVLFCLSRLFHRSVSATTSTAQVAHVTESNRALSRGRHRLAARAAGLMTAFLTDELRRLRVKMASSTSTSEELANMDEDGAPTLQLHYGEEWIWKNLAEFTTELNDAYPKNLFPSLAISLVHLVLSEPPRMWFATPLEDPVAQSLVNQLDSSSVVDGHSERQILPCSVQLVDNTWACCVDRLISLQYAPILEATTAEPNVETKLQTNRKFQHQLVPLDTLRQHLNVDASEEMITTSCPQSLGWLVPGYLPSTIGRYVSPVFWRTTKEYRFSSILFGGSKLM
ncbi:hypothetical protein PHET_01266 [Paragonimus heterotremus]|uniref:Uncharacterized protein n=1 Tax=Paragonimus heterotremus TaxID=100268 RepID=A0A8J4WKL0_9TREM|nr:hypothetical protein PHET_01266 [Paragonimus heterotremus]